jgi:uncharacterized protein with von Willebrand factor type A (vWA) domain
VGTTADLYRKNAIQTGDLLRQLDERWKVIIVGDAAMHPAELMQPRGNINPRYESDTRGIDWLWRIRKHFDRSVWLNPDPPNTWMRTRTTEAIASIFPMFPLSVDGIAEAVGSLIGSRQQGTPVH